MIYCNTYRTTVLVYSLRHWEGCSTLSYGHLQTKYFLNLNCIQRLVQFPNIQCGLLHNPEWHCQTFYKQVLNADDTTLYIFTYILVFAIFSLCWISPWWHMFNLPIRFSQYSRLKPSIDGNPPIRIGAKWTN